MEKRIALGNLMLLGDSYTTFEGHIPQGCGAYYRLSGEPEKDVRKVELTWWHRFTSAVNCNLVLNHSYSGSTICNFGYSGRESAEKSFISRFDRLAEEGFFQKQTVDTLLVFGGTNDTWAGSPIGEPKWENWDQEDLYNVAPACGYLLHRIRQVLPQARACFIINAGLSQAVEFHIRQACEKYGAEIIALTEVDKIEGHPTARGMKEIANQVISYFERE